MKCLKCSQLKVRLEEVHINTIKSIHGQTMSWSSVLISWQNSASLSNTLVGWFYKSIKTLRSLVVRIIDRNAFMSKLRELSIQSDDLIGGHYAFCLLLDVIMQCFPKWVPRKHKVLTMFNYVDLLLLLLTENTAFKYKTKH